MKTWIVGGLCVAGAVVVGAYFVPPKPAAPAPTPVVAEAPPAPVAPAVAVVLADVVNVTNIDALLDPPQIPVADADALTVPDVVSVSADHAPAVRQAIPTRIPAAID